MNNYWTIVKNPILYIIISYRGFPHFKAPYYYYCFYIYNIKEEEHHEIYL